MHAIYRYGDVLMVPYTPAVDVDAGTIIPEGDKCYIAHHDIAANTEGAVGASGGVYEVLAAEGDTIALGDKLYWNSGDYVATETVSVFKALGWCAADKASADTTMMVEHGAW